MGQQKGKERKEMGKEGHYSQQTLKHQQQVHQVSDPVTNNVTTFPIIILNLNFQNHSHLMPKTKPYTL